MKKQKLFRIIENLGWVIEKAGNDTYTLSQFSLAGQDFNIEISGKNTYELIDSIYNCYENFDVSYETYLWLDNTGHGKNGVPYDIEDVLNDMKWCENKIYETWVELISNNK